MTYVSPSFRDSRNCMQYISYWGGRNHIAFVGDSRMRQLYYQFVRTVSNERIKEEKAHSDMHFNVPKFNLKVVSIAKFVCIFPHSLFP